MWQLAGLLADQVDFLAHMPDLLAHLRCVGSLGRFVGLLGRFSGSLGRFFGSFTNLFALIGQICWFFWQMRWLILERYVEAYFYDEWWLLFGYMVASFKFLSVIVPCPRFCTVFLLVVYWIWWWK